MYKHAFFFVWRSQIAFGPRIMLFTAERNLFHSVCGVYSLAGLEAETLRVSCHRSESISNIIWAAPVVVDSMHCI